MSESPPEQHPTPDPSEAAPYFRSWGVWYGVVLALLALLILAFTLFGRAYS